MNSKMTCFSTSPPKCRKPVGGGLTYPNLNPQNYSHNNNNVESVRNSRNSANSTGGGGGGTHGAFGSCNSNNGTNSNNSNTSHHFIVLKGLSHLVVTCRCVVRRIYFAIPWPW